MSEQASAPSSRSEDVPVDMLHRHINAPRASYTIERCWRGPAAEHVSALVNISDVATAEMIIGHLLEAHGAECQVGLVAFPFGLESCDGVRLEVHLIANGC